MLRYGKSRRFAPQPILPSTMAERPALIAMAHSLASGMDVSDETIDAACVAAGVRREQFDGVVTAMKAK